MQLTAQLTTYILTLTLAAFLPGPGMIGLMFKTISEGYIKAYCMLLGLITGDLCYLLISIFCISYISQLDPDIYFYLLLMSSIYLIYLSYQFWNLNKQVLLDQQSSSSQSAKVAYQNGLFITLSNPKTMAFYFALLPTMLVSQSLQQILVLVPITVFILISVGTCYICFSLKLKTILKSLKLQQILLKSLSILMCVLALTMLYSEVSIRYWMV